MSLYWAYFTLIVLICVVMGIIRMTVLYKVYGINKGTFKKIVDDQVLEREFKSNKHQKE